MAVRVVDGFGDRLRQLRDRVGMTQVALAAKADTHEDTIWKLERLQRTPSLSLAMRIAKALGVTLNDLVPAFDPPTAQTG